jgi:hypothetical protein
VRTLLGDQVEGVSAKRARRRGEEVFLATAPDYARAAAAVSETKLGALSNRSIAIMPRAAFATAFSEKAGVSWWAVRHSSMRTMII